MGRCARTRRVRSVRTAGALKRAEQNRDAGSRGSSRLDMGTCAPIFFRRTNRVSDRHGDPRFYSLLTEIAQLHSDKNHDYASRENPLANFEECRGFGVSPSLGVFVRMSDKWSRLKQLVGGKSPKNESVRDSLIDLAVYALINVILLETEQVQEKPEIVAPERPEPEPVGPAGFTIPAAARLAR
jgi:hypothetical protein